jgi:threonylcarbamoyladenosine tRNA methylthiotransferase MtaB
MEKRRLAFHTFGCKLNFSETSTIARNLREDQFQIVDFNANADIYVIHSCAVTAAAEKKCRQAIRHVKKNNPKSDVVVIGCFAQLKPVELSGMEEVTMVLGSKDKFRLNEFLTASGSEETKQIHTTDILKDKSFTPSFSFSDRTRSFLKIQDGCDYFCSYCTIPLARGHSRSATISETVRLAEIIARKDVREIVLTGVNVGDFGKNNNVTLFDLLKEMEAVTDIERIRISSIEPDLLTSGIIHLIASSGRIMPHFHVPLQSGSNKILRSMRRRYTRELFAARVMEIKHEIPDCCIAADVIVGFPGETDGDFQETYRFIESLDISYLHVFSYSGRANTASEKMEGKVPPEVIKARSERLHELSLAKKKTFYEQNNNRLSRVLFETDPEKDYLFGFTENYIRVKTPFNPDLINKIVTLTLKEMDNEGNYLFNFNEF